MESARLCDSNRLKPKLPMTNLFWGPKRALSLMKSIVTQFLNIKLESASSYGHVLLQSKELRSPNATPHLGSSRLWDADWGTGALGHILLQATASILLSDITSGSRVARLKRYTSWHANAKAMLLATIKERIAAMSTLVHQHQASCPRHLRVEITLQKTNVSH